MVLLVVFVLVLLYLLVLHGVVGGICVGVVIITDTAWCCWWYLCWCCYNY